VKPAVADRGRYFPVSAAALPPPRRVAAGEQVRFTEDTQQVLARRFCKHVAARECRVVRRDGIEYIDGQRSRPRHERAARHYGSRARDGDRHDRQPTLDGRGERAGPETAEARLREKRAFREKGQGFAG